MAHMRIVEGIQEMQADNPHHHHSRFPDCKPVGAGSSLEEPKLLYSGASRLDFAHVFPQHPKGLQIE